MKPFPTHSPSRAAAVGSLCLGILRSLSWAPPARSAGFAIGDVYLLSNALPNGAFSRVGIMRLDAVTGSGSLFLDLTTAGGVHGTFSYDAWRDQLLYCTGLTTGGLFGVNAAAISGALAPTTPTPLLVAARGDGKVYLWYSSPEGFKILDAAGNVSDLLDITGTTRFGFGAGKTLEEIIYVPSTNSLLCLTGSVGTNSPCADGTHTCILSVPLNAAGTQVSGAVTSAQYSVSTSSETAVGSAMGPSSSVFVLVDTNSNAQEPRMLLVNPSTLAVSVFASNGSYTGAAATNAGTYSHVTSRALVLDTFSDSLRAFASGETGRGTAIAGGVSGGGTGETARLVEINLDGVTLNAPRAPQGAGGLSLAAPAPNPFRASTLIHWAQPARARVTLTVFDVSGRAVRTLVAGETYPAGGHAATWDGQTGAGRAAPPGLYHAVLTAGGARQVRALVRLR